MLDKKSLILNIIIIVLLVAIICVTILLIGKNNKEEISEESYRNEVKANIIYEYITKPQEEENAFMAEQMGGEYEE